jgi:hypothetical protein
MSRKTTATTRERRLARHLLGAYTNLMDRERRRAAACSECHCEDCLPKMPRRGCCGLGRALREAAEVCGGRALARLSPPRRTGGGR